MGRYNHAYSLGFEVISSEEEAQDVTSEILEKALYSRIKKLVENKELLEACDCPFDTFVIEEKLS